MENRKELQKEFSKKAKRLQKITIYFAVEIVEELSKRDRFNSKYIICRGNRGKGRRVSQGIRSNSTKNDFRNYIWIRTKEEGKEDVPFYMITFNFQDIDGGNRICKNSGNPHMQLGRIQFWSGVNGKKGVCASPHEIISKDGDDITLKFCGNKMSDPKTAIYDEDYDHIKLVDSFLDFLQKSEE